MLKSLFGGESVRVPSSRLAAMTMQGSKMVAAIPPYQVADWSQHKKFVPNNQIRSAQQLGMLLWSREKKL